MVVRTLLIALALQTTSASAQVPMSPASLEPNELEACQPKTLADAAACLETALDAEDAARAAGQHYFRPALDIAMRKAWRLDDPEAPLPRWLAQHGLYKPAAIGGLVIAELGYRRNGGTLDLTKVAKALESAPSDPLPPPDPKLAALLEGRTPDGWTELPIDECGNLTRDHDPTPADQSLGRCFRDADGKLLLMAPAMVEDPADD